MSFSFKASRPLATIMRASLELPWPSASFSLKKAGRGGAGGWKAGCCYGYRDSLIVLLNLPHSLMALSMEQDMKLVVLGDIGVGKTSLIRR